MTYAARILSTALVALAAFAAHADEAAIRKTFAEKMAGLPPIDEITPTPMPGLYEVRYAGTELLYTNESGSFVISGPLLDVRNQRDLTADRVAKLTAVSFDQLPLKDAFTIVRGNGKRKLAIFEDPNCGFCKHFERDLQRVDNVTIYLFLLPILGQDSVVKSNAIWCAKDKGKVWQDWMVRDSAIPPPADSACDTTALARNVQFGQRVRIMATPTAVYADGSRVAGAVSLAEIEKKLADAGP